MWLVILAAAVAGSTGFVAKHFLRPTESDNSVVPEETGQCNCTNEDLGNPIANENLKEPNLQPHVVRDDLYASGLESNSENHDRVFKFSSSGSPRQDRFRSRNKNLRNKPRIGHRGGSKSGSKVAQVEQRSNVELRSEQRKGGKRLPFCSKRRRTTKNLGGNTGICSTKDSPLFGWGVGVGIMYMMSAGKAEISKPNKAIDETASVVQELVSELYRRKSSRTQQILHSLDNFGMKSCKMSGRHGEVMHRNKNCELIDIKNSSLPMCDDGECGSSALTEEPDRGVLEMDQLEAELELELQKLPGCKFDGPSNEELRPKLSQIEVPNKESVGADDQDSCQFHGVLASELNEKLSHLLIKQQENQIAELESELNLAHSKLSEKEAELQALKDCVRRLTELSLSTASDDEVEDCNDQEETTGYVDSESRQSSSVGMKDLLTLLHVHVS